MGEVHDLIERIGRQDALKSAQTDADRRTIEAALSYMGDAEASLGFLYSGWCQAALPHKRLPDDQDWQVLGEHVSLIIEAGKRIGPGGKPIPVGVPYGSRARLILLYLQSEALRTSSRDVELGRSLRQWLGRMNISVGGKSMNIVRDQAERISRCRMTFHIRASGGRQGLVNQNIVDTAMFVSTNDADGQSSLFTETARLSETFFEHLKKHPVPVEDAAIRSVSNNSPAIDIYCWLAYRLHVLTAPLSLSWPALQGQFGKNYNRSRRFRESFIETLRLALAVYPAAKVDVKETCVVLHPSRPPVAPRQIATAPMESTRPR